MQAAPAAVPPGLPGMRASGTAKAAAIFFGVLLLVFAPLVVLDASAGGARGVRGGHLPWPTVQWAVTTPGGALVLIALCLVVIGPPLVLYLLWQLRREIALAVDVTGVPPWAWPSFWQTRPRRLSLHGWLGRTRREQIVSLTLLALVLLLAGGLLGVVVGSGIYGFRAIGAGQCDINGNACPPTFPLTGMFLASWFAAMALAYWAQSRWLRRVEATSGVWLRYRDWVSPRLCYIRPPGVTPEAASGALGRFSSSLTVPFARRIVIGVLAVTPYVVLASASLVVNAWLQFAWMPG